MSSTRLQTSNLGKEDGGKHRLANWITNQNEIGTCILGQYTSESSKNLSLKTQCMFHMLSYLLPAKNRQHASDCLSLCILSLYISARLKDYTYLLISNKYA